MSTRGMDEKARKEALSAKIYAQNAPKIFLETVTARTATLVLAATYIAFIVGFTYDILTVYKGFVASDNYLKAKSCSTQNVSLSSSGLYSWGCTTGDTWEGFVPSLTNIISVSLSIRQDNITSLINSKNNSKVSHFEVAYDLELWACYLPDGCRHSFSNAAAYSGGDWHKVIQLESIILAWDRDTVTELQYFEADLLGNTFQNQESIPAHGKVQSYYFKVKYKDDPQSLFIGNDGRTNSVVYTARILSHPVFYTASGVFSCVLIFIAISTLVGFLYAMTLQKRVWLSEQKWICFYLVALILFINPFYCIIVWFQYVPIEAVFAFYTSDLLGQAAFFVVWLLFADSYRRKSSSRLVFYGPKVLLGAGIFVMSLTMLVYQFPDIDDQGKLNQRSAVSAVQDWSDELKRTFVGVSVALLILVSIWAIWWLTTLYLTGRALQRLPYMNTRYIQLSFRFFTLQALMVAVYYVFQIGAVIFFLLKYAAAGIMTTTDVTGIINTLTRQQTQIFGKVVFLSVYAIVMAFLFLPADIVDQSWATALASTFVVTEKEMRDTVKTRKAAIKDLEHLTAGVLAQVVHAKPEVFCVDIALNLCNISFEAYYDPEGVKTVSGYDTKPMELEKHGWKLVDVHYNPEHETFCYIARHLYAKKMVVCFRGTSCQLHWNDNLNYKQRLLDIQSMALPELDAEDGLDYDPPEHLRDRLEAIEEQFNGHDVDVATSNASTPRVERRRLFGLSGNVEDKPKRTEESDSESDFSLNDEEMMPADTMLDVSTRRVGFVALPYGTPSPPKLSRDRRMSAAGDNTETFGGMLDMGGSGAGGNIGRPRLFSISRARSQSRSVMGGEGGATDGGEEEAKQGEGDDNHNKWAERIVDGAATIGQNVNNVVNSAVDATTVVVGNAADMVANVASQTPGLKNIVQPHVHSGFFEAYSVVRPFVHRTLRRELAADPAHVYFAGHSLGGALATIAAYDCTVHTIPRVQGYLDKKRDATIAEHELHQQRTKSMRSLGEVNPDPRILLARRGRSPSAPVLYSHRSIPSSEDGLSSAPASAEMAGVDISSPVTPPRGLHRARGQQEGHADIKRQKIKVSMYNFGAPRVGNGSFALMYNRTIPDSFRVVIDGDIVTAVPPAGYRHIGTEALIDNLGAGSIIIDPSFVERRLRTHTKTSVSVHSLLVYRKGLKGVKDAVAYLRQYAETIIRQSSTLDIDAAKLAVRAALIKNSLSKMTNIADEPMTALSVKRLDKSPAVADGSETIAPTEKALKKSVSFSATATPSDGKGKEGEAKGEAEGEEKEEKEEGQAGNEEKSTAECATTPLAVDVPSSDDMKTIVLTDSSATTGPEALEHGDGGNAFSSQTEDSVGVNVSQITVSDTVSVSEAAVTVSEPTVSGEELQQDDRDGYAQTNASSSSIDLLPTLVPPLRHPEQVVSGRLRYSPVADSEPAAGAHDLPEQRSGTDATYSIAAAGGGGSSSIKEDPVLSVDIGGGASHIDDIVALTQAFEEVQAQAKRDIEFEEAVHFANDVNNTAMLLEQIEHTGVTPYYMQLASEIANDTVYTIGSLARPNHRRGGARTGRRGSRQEQSAPSLSADTDIERGDTRHGAGGDPANANTNTHSISSRTPERPSRNLEHHRKSMLDRAVKFVWGEDDK